MEYLQKINTTIEKAKEEHEKASKAYKKTVEEYFEDKAAREKKTDEKKDSLQAEIEDIEKALKKCSTKLAETSVSGGDTGEIEEKIQQLTDEKASAERQLEALATYKAAGSAELARAVKDAYDNMLIAEGNLKKTLGEKHTELKEKINEMKATADKIRSDWLWCVDCFSHTNGWGDDAELVKVYESQYGKIEVPHEERYMAKEYRYSQAAGANWR